MTAAMPSVGITSPQAHARKRKREADDRDDEAISPSSRSQRSPSASPSSTAKEARTIGPTLPPADLEERPQQPPDSDATSSSDDDFGPSMPTSTSQRPEVCIDQALMISATASGASASSKSQRDEWMIVPPASGDWSTRMDPTKLKHRKFNTGKGAKGPAQAPGRESNTNWTETPDEKRARLQREMLGLKDISTARGSPEDDVKARENAKRLREYNVGYVAPVPLFYAELTQNRRSREVLHSTRSTKRRTLRRKKMTQVQELLIVTRILLVACRSTIHREEK